MDRARAEAMIAELDRIGREDGPTSARRAERGLFDHVLSPLLEAEGYEVEYRHGPRDEGIDYLARKDHGAGTETLGIEYRHTSPNAVVGGRDVYTTAGVGTGHGLDRMILLTNGRFSSTARTVRHDRFPVALELLDWAALRSWASRAVSASEGAYRDVAVVVRALIKKQAGKFARLVAEDAEGGSRRWSGATSSACSRRSSRASATTPRSRRRARTAARTSWSPSSPRARSAAT